MQRFSVDYCLNIKDVNTRSHNIPFDCGCQQKHMARLEAKAAEQVVEACVRTESVKKCVFTSSLLACVWRKNYPHDRRRFPTTIDESCWSDESFCCDNKASILYIAKWIAIPLHLFALEHERSTLLF
jgi:hypothetical protein